MKKTNTKTIRAILAFIAQGGSIREASEKFKSSHSAVNSIVRGVTHTNITGLEQKTEKSGVDYIRNNKDLFVTSMKKKEKADAPEENTATTPVKPVKPSIEKTVKSVETKPVAVTVDVADNIEAMRSNANAIVTKIDTRMETLKAEMEQLSQQREHWMGMATSLNA